jgi:hypothetical protein
MLGPSGRYDEAQVLLKLMQDWNQNYTKITLGSGHTDVGLGTRRENLSTRRNIRSK